MKEGKNNLMKGVERLSKLVAHVKSLNGQVSIIERDLLLQELRELYMEVLSLEVASEGAVSDAEDDGDEVVAFENIMQEMPAETMSGVAMATEAVENAVEEKVIEAPVEEKEEVTEVEMENEEVTMTEESEEESPFAPAEPEPVMEPAPEPVMEKIEGNQYEDLFEEPKKVERVEEEVKVAEVKQEEKVEEKLEEKIEEKPEEKLEEKPIVKHEEKPVVKHEEKHEEKHAEKKHQAQPEQPSLFDYLSQSVSTVAETTEAPATLADKLSVNKSILETQLEQKVNRHKVSDLRTVININDKFSFMTELFHNNMRAYNDFILALNAMEDKDEAMKYIAKVSKDNEWDEYSLAVKTFYKILERKF